MAETDTLKSSVITDHAFVPRWMRIQLPNGQQLPQSRYLCGYQKGVNMPCGLAEAAHRETTVKR